MAWPLVLGATIASAAACDGTPEMQLDAAPSVDAAVDMRIDTRPTGPLGILTGQCGELDDTEWQSTTPYWFGGVIAFGTDRYDHPLDRPRLTPGGQILVDSDNAGGSSIYSEVFAFEWLARCEDANLVKTETQIIYDTQSKKADLLVTIDNRKIGVSVTRFVAFPFGANYTAAAATSLLTKKLDDLKLATASVNAADKWERTMVVAQAYNEQHAATTMAAWTALSAEVRSDTILIVTVTNGDDAFIYSDM